MGSVETAAIRAQAASVVRHGKHRGEPVSVLIHRDIPELCDALEAAEAEIARLYRTEDRIKARLARVEALADDYPMGVDPEDIRAVLRGSA